MLDVQGMFHELVQAVPVHIGKQLACEVPHGDAHAVRQYPVLVNDTVHKEEGFLVPYVPPIFLFQFVMWNGCKVFAYVPFKAV